MHPLYERLGGEPAIEAAVVRFYEKVAVDPLLAPFFVNQNIEAIVKKQIGFMTMVFGGPTRFSGRDLRAAHAPLVARGLGDRHFDAVAMHLENTLLELGVNDAVIVEVMNIVGATRDDVLGR